MFGGIRSLFGRPSRPATKARRAAALCVEALEERYALATLLGATTLSYRDKDGDLVAVSFSKPILTAANVNAIFTFDSGAGAVNGSNAKKEQLQKVNLTFL